MPYYIAIGIVDGEYVEVEAKNSAEKALQNYVKKYNARPKFIATGNELIGMSDRVKKHWR